MAKTNWGAGFYLDTEALVFEAADREDQGQGRVLPGSDNCAPRWIPHPKLGKGSKPAPHPMSAGQREQNGRPSRAHREPQDCGPTPELLMRLAEAGATDMIQRISPPSKGAVLTEDEQKALEMFGQVRRIIGVAETRYKTTLDAMIPGGGGHANPDVMDWAMAEYRAAIHALGRYADACQDITDNRPPRTMDDVRAGARELAKLWIRGEAKKHLTPYAQSA